MLDLVIVGGGAAGLFAAANCTGKVVVLERSGHLLSKVRISGGGRCNVTHSCFDPKQLVQHYPRGHKELLGPFTRFGPQETIDWFAERGVELKTEKDGRMFPKTNTSETIIHTLLTHVQGEIRLKEKISEITPGFTITLASGEVLKTRFLLLATGSHPQGHALAEQLGHTIIPPVPSLFTFNVPTSPLKHLSGIAVQATVSLPGTRLKETGPLLITHFGFSGPAILKLSAWGARFLHEKGYRTPLHIIWHTLPSRLLKTLDGTSESTFQIEGKTTHKAEFVTCGGVSLKEVNFKTMESKVTPGLFFAGEILNIDGVTGGFNFQNAWTTAFTASERIRQLVA